MRAWQAQVPASAPGPARTGRSVEAIKRDFMDNLFYVQARFRSVATKNDYYQALAYTVRDRLLEGNETIAWHPPHIKHGRFGDWLENNVDWALSRDRFWGTPIPVWRCRDCGLDTCVGSVEELSKLAGESLTDLDLHRPYVDDVIIDCPGCDGGRAWRVEPVLDRATAE